MPLHSKKHINNGIVALWRIEETKEELFDLLPTAWRAKLDIDSMSRHNVAARVLAFTVCPDFDSIEKDEYGKPYFVSKDYPISITHAGDYAGFMYTQDRECGIDIEQITHRIERIQHKFIREDEKAFAEAGLKGMYMVWCAKEAMYKYYGLKALDFKANLQLQFEPFDQEGTLQGIISKNEYKKAMNLHYQFFDEYLLIHTQ